MNLRDNYDTREHLMGILKAEIIKDDGSAETLFEDKNQIVVDSGYLIRQFLVNDENTKGIKYIAFGDMNLTEKDDTKNIRPATCNDYKLDNEVFRKEVTYDLIEDDYGYGVVFSVILEKDECNGSTGEQLITEYALLSESIYGNTAPEEKQGKNIMFSRKTRAAIYKDYEMKLKFSWTIYFKKVCE